MAAGEEPPRPKLPGGLEINPELFNKPLNKLSGVLRDLVVKPAADALADAAQRMADAAGSVSKGLETKADPASPAEPAAAGTDPSTARPQAPQRPAQARPGTDVLVRSQAVTGPLRGTTDPLASRSSPSGSLELSHAHPEAAQAKPAHSAPASDIPQDPAALEVWLKEQAALSDRRMNFIVQYLKDPSSSPDFSNKPLVYRIVTQERSYQQALVGRLQQQLESAPSAQRGSLQETLLEAQRRQSQLFIVLKKITGRSGHTGGTGYLGSGPAKPAQGPGAGSEG
ncbi:MAG: hypothetical protein VKP62_15475 [Candidatus Sericytochromatia bacterium]|nr:hypothetical protein [Candidatus Sericytochromatia bacterium]